MSFYKEHQSDNTNYKVIEIRKQDIPELQCELHERLIGICYGIKKPANQPEDYTYKKTCSKMVDILIAKTNEQKYGLIGELLMHLVVPKVLSSRKFESISLLLSIVDNNIKHGFDLNFYEAPSKKIWYGEVKSGINIARAKLIDKAKRGLFDYFNELSESNQNNINSRWEAAKNEVLIKYSDKKGVALSKMLSTSKTNIEKGSGGKNAIMMAVVYGDKTDLSKMLDFSDIKTKIKKYTEQELFDDFIIIAIHKKIYDDIIEFLKKERLENE